MSRCTLGVVFLIAVPVLAIVVILLWFWLRPSEEEKQPAQAREAVTKPPVASETTAKPAPAAESVKSSKPDDLKRIEGIGPKISALLQEAGIVTFVQLAATDVGRLEQILAQARLSALADPSTWPEQARLAAAADWDALDALQEKLKGGRRI